MRRIPLLVCCFLFFSFSFFQNAFATTCSTCTAIGGLAKFQDGSYFCDVSWNTCPDSQGWEDSTYTITRCMYGGNPADDFFCLIWIGRRETYHLCQKTDSCIDGTCSDYDSLDAPVIGALDMCRFSWVSCPVWWSQFQNWSTTSPAHGWWNTCDYDLGCLTGWHSWGNISREACTYLVKWRNPNWTCSDVYYQNAYANITEVWCTPPPDPTPPTPLLSLRSMSWGVQFLSDTWTNTGILVFAGWFQEWPKTLKTVVLFQKIDDWMYQEIQRVNDIWVKNTFFIVTPPIRFNAQNWKKVSYKVQVTNSSRTKREVYSPTISFDTILPADRDITYTPTSWTNHLATLSKIFSINVHSNGGSPINSIRVKFTDYNKRSSTYLPSIFSSSSSSLSFSPNISSVDNDIKPDGSKSYYLWVIWVCDQAGNCLDNPESNKIQYNVFANSSSLGPISVSQSLGNTNNIADGSIQTLFFTLKDIYGNAVVSATPISRTIDFIFSTYNTSYLNQYTRQGESGVFLSLPNNVNDFQDRFWHSSQTTVFSHQTYNSWVYPFNFKVYTPTWNFPQSDTLSKFVINSITAHITGNMWANSVSYANPINFSFKPLVNTTINGGLKTDNFYEWKIQNSTIDVVKDSSVSLTKERLYLEFWSGARVPALGLVLKVIESGVPNQVISNGHQTSISGLSPPFLNTLDTSGHALISKLTRLWGSAVSNIRLYLSTHISYVLDGKNIAYNGDVLNKPNYWDDNVTSSGITELWVKVIWIVTSVKKSEVINGQFVKDIMSLWNFNKATIKNDIISRIYTIVKNVQAHNGNFKITDLQDFSPWVNDGVSLVKGTVLYFGWLDGNTVTLWNAVEKVSGKKTIVIVWWNLYIKNDMYYDDKTKDILWMVVLKDENGKWGNIYIDPNVTNIVWTMVADRSLISYDGIQELDGTHDFDLLKNQLHIYGSLITENTLWGSRLNPAKCPYFETSCTLEVAEKYDLNFLRRYNLWKNGLPLWWGRVIWWGICSLPTKTCAGGNTSFARNITNLATDLNAKYSLVIEYNPLISKVYPPLFAQ